MQPSTAAPAPTYTRADLATWAVAAVALGLIIELHLLSALLAGLLVYKLVDVLTPWLRLRALSRDGARILAVTLIASAVIATLVGVSLGVIALLRNSGESVPQLLQKMAQIVEEARTKLPVSFQGYLPVDAEGLQQALGEWLRANVGSLQLAGKGIGRSLAHILIGMIIGALLSMQKASTRPDRRPLTQRFVVQSAHLASAFQRVVFAQVWISLINTLFTWIYLDVVLRAFGVDVPLVKTLVAVTFVVGLIPIVGNLISNTTIVIVCLSKGLPIAAVSLVFLIVIHKLEYFLNARIVGTRIRARSWEILTAMLVMESAFGIAGVIAASIYYAYIKDELADQGMV
jgi:predicted PurR-regulated permease PerM